MPLQISFNDGTKRIDYAYDAAGIKCGEKVKDGDEEKQRTYIAGYEFVDGKLSSSSFEEGRIYYLDADEFEIAFYLQDHLGNNRIIFKENPAQITEPLVLQENHYYPFGMTMGSEMNYYDNQDPEDRHKYNSKELVEDCGLDFYDYGARWYDASIGRWTSVDPLASDYAWFSPYGYVLDNPISLLDPDGRSVETDFVNKSTGEHIYINDGVDHRVSSSKEFVEQSSWTQKTNIDLSDYVGFTVTLKFKWVNKMIPLFSTDQVRLADKYAIEKLGLYGTVLMENASRSVFEEILKHFPELTPGMPVGVVAGKGNNGGDAFALSRHLINYGFSVTVISLASEKELKGDAEFNYKVLKKLIARTKGSKLIHYKTPANLNSLANCVLIADGILGTGAKGGLREPFKSVVKKLNSFDAIKVAIDSPTGLDLHNAKADEDTFRADLTVTFAELKAGLFYEGGYKFAGKVVKGTIGIGDEFFDTLEVKE